MDKLENIEKIIEYVEKADERRKIKDKRFSF